MSTSKQSPRPFGIALIAVGKLLKCVLLIAAGIFAVVAARDTPQVEVERFADALRIDPGGRYLYRISAAVLTTSQEKFAELGVGAFAYAALFAVEGIGLWLQKRWAEWLTIVITLSFIPLEIYELARHVSVLRIVALVLNVAVLAYLLVRAARRRASERHHATSTDAAILEK